MEDIFILNRDQRAILETVSRFVEGEVKPRAAALDANPDPEKSFSWEIVEKAHELGIRTMTLGEAGLGREQGGARGDCDDQGARAERRRRGARLWAIQAHGGGLAEDFPLAYMYAHSRTLRFADGPDEVHRNAIAKLELARHMAVPKR